ncbi:DUF739 family protein [Vagococcus sp. BWB3-3]|uniref:DUF739 family protein n=1 Tax=Vagococcus allomyrinae TaxID=2794353 RepID=A0A940SR46_9ENTE|nr:DUF739 family protein [Vagococcus allomyrinae]MBP1040407.1 DUF739 family protein [Vagococcus allomyrinae]
MEEIVYFDYSELRGRFRSRGFTQEELAKSLKMSKTSLSNKLNNKARFDSIEILALSSILGICDDDISLYFFKVSVQKTELKELV